MSQSSGSKPSARLSRRRFLRVAAGAGLTAALSACQPRRPSPTPTPTRTPRPSATQPGAPAPTGTPLPSQTPTPASQALVSPLLPTETPTFTPEPSNTPLPTNTPTPTATLFPPGPPTKLGLFITRNEPKMRELLDTRNVALVKTLEYDPNFLKEIRQRAPDAVLIARLTLPQADLAAMTDPLAAARGFVDQLLPIATDPRRAGLVDAWESFNEPVADNAEHMGRLAQFEAERTRLLAEAGVRSVIGNFGTGSPPLELWPAFRPAVEMAIRHKGYLGLHEYSAPTLQFGTPQDPLGWGIDPAQEGWLTLRYRKVHREFLQPNGLEIPILMTEAGIDGTVANRPGPGGKGWQDFARYWDELGMGSDAPGNYVEQLAWYDAQLQADKYVLGAAIFVAGASPGWEFFEILDAPEQILRQYISVHPPR